MLPTFFLVLAGVAWLITRQESVGQALKLVTSKAAFLVPACATILGYLLIDEPLLHENPFGISDEWGAPPIHEHMPYFMAWGLGSVTLAGHIGLLEAHAHGQRVDGNAFLAGIRRHTPVIAGFKLALAASVTALSSIAWSSTEMRYAWFLIPNLLVAPAIGFITRYPGRPLEALSASLQHVREHTTRVGTIVTAQAGVVLTLMYFAERIGHWRALSTAPAALTTLGFNPAPFVLMNAPGGLVTVLTLFSVITSSVFVTAHWLSINPAGAGATARTAEALRT